MIKRKKIVMEDLEERVLAKRDSVEIIRNSQRLVQNEPNKDIASFRKRKIWLYGCQLCGELLP